MFLTLHRKKAQTVAEYAILIGLVIAAITGVQFFVKSGIQKQIKLSVDHLEAEGVGTMGAVAGIDMTGISSTTSTNQDVTDSETLAAGGVVSRTSNGSVDSTQTETITW